MPSAATLETVRAKIESGYETYGSVHRVLDTWHRVDPVGVPGGGSLLSTTPLKFDDDMDDKRIAAIINLEQLALPFAQGEADLYFADPGRSRSAAAGKELDRAVRDAVSRSWGYGGETAIWVNHGDEQIVERSGAIAAVHPVPILDATWHRTRVIYTNVVRAGSLWIAGAGAGTLTFYPDDAGRRIHVAVRVVGGTRFLEASLRLALLRRDAAVMQRIDITPTS